MTCKGCLKMVEIHNETFMAMVLNKAIIKGVSGVVCYRSEFDEAM